MPSILITVDIEIKPYLKKFLLSKSTNKIEPIRLPRKHNYNILLWRLVTNYNNLLNIPVADKQNVINYFKESAINKKQGVSIILPFSDRKDVRSYNYLSIKSKKSFRNEVRLDFNFEFARDLFRGLKSRKQRLNIVNEFKQKHNITEDDLKSESLYRYSSRLLQEF